MDPIDISSALALAALVTSGSLLGGVLMLVGGLVLRGSRRDVDSAQDAQLGALAGRIEAVEGKMGELKRDLEKVLDYLKVSA